MIHLVLQIFKAIFKLTVFLCLISLFLVHGAFIYCFNLDPTQRRKKLVENAHRYAKNIVSAYGVTVICKNLIPDDEHCLLVGNHLGFVDIMCLVSLRSGVFVTSTEMRRTPVLGQVTEVAGCTYVDRKNRMKIQNDLKGLANLLKQGFRIVLYAESVTSNGEQVLPFKKTLLLAAAMSGVPIRPFVFNVRKVNNQPVSMKDRDAICWYDDMSFASVTWKALILDSIECEIEFLPLVFVKPDEDRKVLADHLHKMVSEKYRPFC